MDSSGVDRERERHGQGEAWTWAEGHRYARTSTVSRWAGGCIGTQVL